jgi:hypothetical protein
MWETLRQIRIRNEDVIEDLQRTDSTSISTQAITYKYTTEEMGEDSKTEGVINEAGTG